MDEWFDGFGSVVWLLNIVCFMCIMVDLVVIVVFRLLFMFMDRVLSLKFWVLSVLNSVWVCRNIICWVLKLVVGLGIYISLCRCSWGKSVIVLVKVGSLVGVMFDLVGLLFIFICRYICSGVMLVGCCLFRCWVILIWFIDCIQLKCVVIRCVLLFWMGLMQCYLIVVFGWDVCRVRIFFIFFWMQFLLKVCWFVVSVCCIVLGLKVLEIVSKVMVCVLCLVRVQVCVRCLFICWRLFEIVVIIYCYIIIVWNFGMDII